MDFEVIHIKYYMINHILFKAIICAIFNKLDNLLIHLSYLVNVVLIIDLPTFSGLSRSFVVNAT